MESLNFDADPAIQADTSTEELKSKGIKMIDHISILLY
jgi:hypothetical protein